LTSIEGETAIKRTGWQAKAISLFSGLLVVSCGLLIVGSILLHQDGARHRIAMLLDDEEHAIGMRQDAVTRVIEATVSDLLFLADLNEVRPFLRDRSASNRIALEQELVAFSRNREVYNQIRILSATGMELLRVNYANGQAVVVPSQDLQDKSDRTYFQDLAQCGNETIYVSPLDLNVENGVLEVPLNPVMRFALQIGDTGNDTGYLLPMPLPTAIQAQTQSPFWQIRMGIFPMGSLWTAAGSSCCRRAKDTICRRGSQKSGQGLLPLKQGNSRPQTASSPTQRWCPMKQPG